MELSRKRLLLAVVAFINPLPAPKRNINMNIPHATANPVRAVRNLLRFAVDHISDRISYMLLWILFHQATRAERTCLVIQVFFDITDKTILDVDDFIGFISHSTLVSDDEDGLMFLLV